MMITGPQADLYFLMQLITQALGMVLTSSRVGLCNSVELIQITL